MSSKFYVDAACMLYAFSESIRWTHYCLLLIFKVPFRASVHCIIFYFHIRFVFLFPEVAQSILTALPPLFLPTFLSLFLSSNISSVKPAISAVYYIEIANSQTKVQCNFSQSTPCFWITKILSNLVLIYHEDDDFLR